MDVGFLQLCCRFSNVIPFTKIKQLLFLSLSLLSALKFPWGRENWTRDRKPGYNRHIQPDLVGIPWSRPFLSLGFEFCICINMKSASKVQGFQDKMGSPACLFSFWGFATHTFRYSLRLQFPSIFPAAYEAPRVGLAICS